MIKSKRDGFLKFKLSAAVIESTVESVLCIHDEQVDLKVFYLMHPCKNPWTVKPLLSFPHFVAGNQSNESYPFFFCSFSTSFNMKATQNADKNKAISIIESRCDLTFNDRIVTFPSQCQKTMNINSNRSSCDI